MTRLTDRARDVGARRGGEEVEDAITGSDTVGMVGVSLRDAEDMFDGGRSESELRQTALDG